jgi:hypothetical protein
MHILNNPRWLTFFSRNKQKKTKQKKNNQFLQWQIHMFKSYGALAIENKGQQRKFGEVIRAFRCSWSAISCCNSHYIRPVHMGKSYPG